MELALAIRETESKGNCSVRGKDEEVGCFQYLPSSWRQFAKHVLGYVPPHTDTNHFYVAARLIEKMLEQGYSARQIAWWWNSGRTDKCIKGINKNNVPYDSCAYADTVLKNL